MAWGRILGAWQLSHHHRASEEAMMARVIPFSPPDPMSFLSTEVKTGLTFSRIALRSPDQDTVTRNRANARKAYNTTLRFMMKFGLTEEDCASLQSPLAKLRSNLLELGEAV